MRVSDAACLAAYHCYTNIANNIQMMQEGKEIVLYDVSKPLAERIIYRGSMDDTETAADQYSIACFRPIVEAALNIV